MKNKEKKQIVNLNISIFIITFLLYIASYFPHHLYSGNLNGEHNLVENLQFLVLLATSIIAFIIICRNKSYRLIWILFLIGCIYIAGEEISWGQHFFKWTTVDWLKEVNDQNETNLHNVSSWFDQKPRLIMEIAIYIGAIILPIIFMIKKELKAKLPLFFKTFVPESILIPPALLVLLSRFIYSNRDKIVIYVRHSEMHELCIYFFLFIYSFYFLKKNRKQ